MNPFTLVNGEPYPLDMRGELDDTAAFKNFKKYVFIHILFWGNLQLTWDCCLGMLLTYFVSHPICFGAFRWGNVEFPLPFGRVLSSTESFIHSLDEKVITWMHVLTFFYLPILSCMELPLSFCPLFRCINNILVFTDKFIFEIHCFEPKGTYLDNGCWRWCQCYICWYCRCFYSHML